MSTKRRSRGHSYWQIMFGWQSDRSYSVGLSKNGAIPSICRVSHDCRSSSTMGESITWARKKRSQKFPHLQKFNFIQCFNSCFYSSQSGAYLSRGVQLFSLSSIRGCLEVFRRIAPHAFAPNVDERREGRWKHLWQQSFYWALFSCPTRIRAIQSTSAASAHNFLLWFSS